MKDIKKPEILSPAGNMEKLQAAFLYGADGFRLQAQHVPDIGAGDLGGVVVADDGVIQLDAQHAVVAHLFQRGLDRGEADVAVAQRTEGGHFGGAFGGGKRKGIRRKRREVK